MNHQKVERIEIKKGNYFYSLSKTGAGSEKYGHCEVCKQSADTVYHQSEYRLVTLDISNKRYQGLTMKRCVDYFGHQACLQTKRRGDGSEQVLPTGSIKSIIDQDNLNLMKTEILIDMGYINDQTTVVAAHA